MKFSTLSKSHNFSSLGQIPATLGAMSHPDPCLDRSVQTSSTQRQSSEMRRNKHSGKEMAYCVALVC